MHGIQLFLWMTLSFCRLQRHAAEQQIPSSDVFREDYLMPNCYSAPSKHHKTQAMQMLATQRGKCKFQKKLSNYISLEPIPGSATALPIGRQNIYPRLPEVSLTTRPISSSITTGSQSIPSLSCVTSQQKTKDSSGDVSRFDRLRRILGILLDNSNHHYQQPAPGTIVDLNELRKECWLGIPQRIRPLAWRILSGYLPTNLDRREVTLKRKRDEYWDYVEQYFHTRYDEQHQITFRQIHIDIPRMCPLIPLFQQKKVQEMFERVLYIWAIRHPASGYVQGINDLVTPFFIVFLSEFIPDGSYFSLIRIYIKIDTDLGSFDLSLLNREQVEIVEADSFWCVSALLDTIQDNYTFAQPGIQRKVNDLRELISRVERNLYTHFESNGVEFLQFSFRWMNNLLMREIPLRTTIRLWDTYLGIMLKLQSLPTQNWNDQQICELTAGNFQSFDCSNKFNNPSDAYSLMQFFHGAKSHLQK
ncbi:unnamed protein product [Meloidogyne enterolobii]|uniref:Uncharacterized protein n=1 Tax=Meloidogyne enterolobii TaxID=390850 RepID=A0ACB1B541_MELEN